MREARLAGIAYAPHQADARPSSALNSRALEVLARAQRAADTSPSVEAVRVLAAGEMARGRPDLAIALLSQAAEREEATGELAVDLSAAYLASASATDAPALLLARALETALQPAGTSASRPEMWFNAAIALERARLVPEAIEAWDRVLAVETDPDWRQEAERRRASARGALAPSAASVSSMDVETTRASLELNVLPAWGRAYAAGRHVDAQRILHDASQMADALVRAGGDPLPAQGIATIASAAPPQRSRLASAHQAYADGITKFEANERETARQLFDGAVRDFGAANSDYADAARAQRAIVFFGLREFERGEREGVAVAGRAARRGHLVVAGDAFWVQGVTVTERGDLEGALAAFTHAIDSFTRAKEMDRAIRATNSAADTLRIMGHDTLGWTFLGKALTQLDRVRNPRGRQVILLNASLYASAAGLHRAARVFQDASLRVAGERGAENAIVEGHIRRARLSLAVRDLASARRDLAIANDRLDAVRSAASREYLRAWLDSVRGELLLAEDNRSAAPIFDDAIRAFARLEPAEVPRLYLLRGRSALPDAVGEAERAFRTGIDELQRRMLMLNQQTHRVSYLDEGWKLFDELITLQVATGTDANRAFGLAERARVRAASDASTSGRSPIERPEQLAAVVPTDGAVLYYVSLEDRLLAWVIRPTQTSLVTLPIGTEALTSRVTAYRRLLEAGASGAPARRAAEDLYRLLLQPLVNRLAGVARVVIVPDGALHAVPFAGVIDPSNGEFVGNRYALSTVPSATVLLALAPDRSSSVTAGQKQALIVGVGNGVPERNLPALPLVRREMADLEAVYPRATVLTGAKVDAKKWRAVIANHDVVHFAGHAVVNTQYPDLSELILGSQVDGTTAVVTAGEIAKWPLDRVRLVTLSACQTAYGALYRGEGLSSLARRFVSAGVKSVVGTLWSVGDDIAHRLSVRFHADYARSGRPVAALQESQRALVRGGLDPIVVWNAFTVIGAFD